MDYIWMLKSVQSELEFVSDSATSVAWGEAEILLTKRVFNIIFEPSYCFSDRAHPCYLLFNR